MTDNISKITKILLLVLFVISILFAVKFYMGASLEDVDAKELSRIEEVADNDGMLSSTDSLTEERIAAINWLGYFLKFSYIIGILAAIFAVGFSIWNFALKFMDSPKKGLMALIPIILVLIVVFIAYSNASSDLLTMPSQYDGTDNVPNILKWTGTGMITMYIFFALAVGSIIYVEIAKAFK